MLKKKENISVTLFFFSAMLLSPVESVSQEKNKYLGLEKTILGKISPKSIVCDSRGYAYAQNMMYQHSITAYDSNYNLNKTIFDSVTLSRFGHEEYPGFYRGAPVEACLDPQEDYLWVSNYKMYGDSMNNPGTDNCSYKQKYDPGFLYKISLNDYEVKEVIRVGSVPKYLAYHSDKNLVLTSNWCEGTVSIVSTIESKELKKVYVGAYPRGISYHNNKAYVCIMGGSQLAVIDLENYSVKTTHRVGRGPRHIVYDSLNKLLWVSINHEDRVIAYDPITNNVVKKIKVKDAPRSMAIDNKNHNLYVVQYGSNLLTKINLKSKKIEEEISTNKRPIGISVDEQREKIWVACYSGSIQVFSYSRRKANFSLAEKDKYYVIIGSHASEYRAKESLKKLEEYSSLKILKSEENRFRVSFFESNKLEEALEKMEYAQKNIVESAWILKK